MKPEEPEKPEVDKSKASEVIEYLLNHRQTTSLEPEVFVNSDLVTRWRKGQCY